jgi:hypothetical protein
MHKVVFGAGSLLLASLAAVSGAERAADSGACKSAISRIVELTGATFDHVSPSGENVFLRHPVAETLRINCTPGLSVAGSIDWDGAYPPAPYFSLVGAVGAVLTGARPVEVERAARRCQRAALLAAGELADVTTPRMRLNCQAFSRDGGGTAITLSRPD